MATNELEIILSRQFADALSVPIFITDTEGTLVFFNEPAETFLGVKYAETGAMTTETWTNLFAPTDENGNRVHRIDLPLVRTLTYCQPAQAAFWVTNGAGQKFHLSVTSFPLMGRSNRFVGAIAIFWEKRPV